MSDSRRVGSTMTLRGKVKHILLRAVHKISSSVTGVWSIRPSIDLLIVIALVSAHAVVVYVFHKGNVLAWAQSSQRTDTYAAGAGISALIGGFTATAIALYASSTGAIVQSIRAVHGSKIRRNWLSITCWLLGASALCIISMAVDGGQSTRGSNWIFEVAFCVVLLKFARLIYLFSMIMDAVDKQDENAVELDRRRRQTARAIAGQRASSPQSHGIEFDDDY